MAATPVQTHGFVQFRPRGTQQESIFTLPPGEGGGCGGKGGGGAQSMACSIYRADCACLPRLCTSFTSRIAIVSLQIIAKVLKMSDALEELSKEPQQLSTSRLNVQWLSGIDGIEARLIIKAIQCPNYPIQHYWLFQLQVAVPDGLEFTAVHCAELLTQADKRAYELRQTQKWVFIAEAIQFLRHSGKRTMDDDMNPSSPQRPKFSTDPCLLGLMPTSGPLEPAQVRCH